MHAVPGTSHMGLHACLLITLFSVHFLPSLAIFIFLGQYVLYSAFFLVQDLIEFTCSEFREVSRAVLQLISETSTVHVRAVFGLSIWMCAAVSRTK